MNKLHWSIFTMLVLLVTMMSCSSISRKPVSQAKQKSREFLEQARREELKQNYTDALSIYSDAQRYSILANEIDIQLISLQGMARIAYIKADSTSYNKAVSSMQNIIININPELYYRALQLEYWQAFYTHKYGEIAANIPKYSTLPLNVKIELLSYIVQAQARLHIEDNKHTVQLEKAVNRYYVKLKRKMTIQPELVSNAYYSLAYAYTARSMYNEALSKLSKAIILDKGYDLYIQLADDYALAGKCEQKRNNQEKAIADLSIAKQIYQETNQVNEVETMETLISNIKGKK